MKDIIVAMVCLFYAGNAAAQAVPDTSLQQVIPDSTRARQADVANATNDGSASVYTPSPTATNPKKAALYSAVLPGAGQLYNKQYWKIPVIYAAAGAAVYFIKSNNDKYQTYRKAYIADLQGKTHEFSGIYSTASLKQLQDGYKRYLDLTILLTGVGYTLQVLDALVFAHLKDFDVSQDISLRMQPIAQPNGGAGFGLVCHF